MITRRVGILVALLTLLSAHQALAAGDTYFTAQCRVMDTRISMGGPTLAAGEKRVLTLTGSCGPPADALAVALNIVVVQPAAPGYAVLFPGDAPTPATSVLNFRAGQVRANNAIVALAGNGSGTIALVNGSNGMADYVIDISGYFKTGCPPITVSPAGPALPAGTSGTPYNQTFTASGGTGPYTFAVTSGALPANLNLASGGLLSGTPIVAGDFAFTVTATDTATGCTGSNAYTLHINCGTLTVAITPTPAQVCSGSAGNSASATGGFATYSWTITNGTIQGSTTGQTISYTAGASGTVGLTVNVTDASACPGQGTASVPISANPATPSIATSNPQTFTVSGGAGTFTLTFNGQTTSALAFNATAAQVQTALNALSSIGGVGGSVTVTQAGGVYTVTFGGTLTGPQPQMTATGAGGCIVVVSGPAVCAGSTGNQASGPAGATTYAWTITNGTITSATNIQTITYTAGASGNVTLNLTITNPGGCSASNSALVAINPSPATPTITPTPAQVCASSTGNTAAGPAGATTYAWTITNGTITSATNIQTITYTAGASGNVTLNLTVTNASGCAASNSANVPINANPATPTITPTPAQVCASSTGNTAAGPAGATTYAWTATNGTVTSATNIQTITYTAGASGNVTLTLTVTNAAGCSAGNTALVPINALPATPSIATSNPQMFTVSGGAGTFTLTFNGQTTSSLAFNATAAQVQTALTALSSIGGAGGSVVVNQAGGVYTVTFGGTLTGPQPQLTATGAGGCTVVVSAPAVCADSTGNQASGPAGATTYAWTITNGTITSATNVQTITYTAGSSGTVTLNLTVTNGPACSASNSAILTINPTPATPTITPTPAQVCAGSTGNTAAGPAGATTYAWTIGNGTITSATNIQTITYTAGASGNVTLNLTVTNASGCPASNSSLVPINASPGTPSITPTPAQVCANSTGNTADGPAGATSYAWTATNGTITSATNVQTITYTAGASGNVTLNLTVTNAAGCAASNAALVPINANPATPSIATSNPQTFTVSGVAGTFTLTFNGQTTSSLAFNATAAQVQTALTALSSIGGVGGSVVVNQAGGVYTVTFGGTLTGPQPQMTATGAGGCTVVVSAPAVCADTTGNQASGPAGATTYAWTITNGTITSATNIQTITYTAGSSGTVTLNLTVTNAAACSASNSVIVTINANPASPSITAPSNVCDSSTGNTASGPAGATTYLWTITNGTITSANNIQNITFTAGATGTTLVLSLTVTNAAGCSASNTANVTVDPKPAAPTITPSPAQVCAGSTGNQATGPAGATTYAWSITNGTITSATNIQTITYTAGVAAGNVGLTLVVTNAQGCSASNTVNVTKNPNPTLAPGAGALPMGTYNTAYSQTFTPGGGTGPYTVVFLSGTLPNGITFSSNAISGTPIQPGGIATGNFSFTLRVTDTATSCFSDVAYTLYVQPKAVADACTGVGNTQLAGGVLASPPTTPFSTNCNGVLANDEGPGALTAALSGAATNGTVTVNSNGTFLFTPNLNATTGGFNYTLTDGNGATAIGTVTLTFTGRVWYVNSTTGSDSAIRGRSHEPLLTIAQAVTNSSANDNIFVHFTGTNYAGASLSKDGLTLWGQGTTFTLGNLTITGTSKPTINSTLTIAGNNQTVSSLDASTGTTTGITNTGTRTGLTIKNNIAVTTTTGTAVSFSNVDSTAGGAPNNGINFRSVSSNGAANGISLTNVNATTGSFTVAGNGGTCSSAASCTGGAIQASSGPGVVLTNTGAVSFSNFDVEAGGDDGFRGSVVRGFTLASSRVVNNGNAVTERGIELLNLTGTGSISNSTISGNAEDNLFIQNTSGTLSSFNVTGSTFSNTSTSIGNDGIHFEGQGTANMTISVTGSTFNHNRGDHFQVVTDAVAPNVIMNATFSGNTLTGDRGTTYGGTDLGACITINPGGAANVTYDIENNNITGAVSSAISINSSNTSVLHGTLNNNTIGTVGTIDSGSSQGDGFSIFANGSSAIRALITNNVIRQYSNLAGINIQQRSGSATVQAVVTGNTISNGGTFAAEGIFVSAGTAGGDSGTMCLDIGGAGALANSFAGSGANGSSDFRVRQRFSTTVRLPGYGGANTDTAAVVLFIRGRNTGSPSGQATVAAPPGGGFVGGAACTAP